MIERHYKTGEIAELLSLHPETLRRAAQRGELRPVRVGRDLLWPESEVQSWLDVNRQTDARVVPLRSEDRASSSTTRRSA